jgi:hypothetical protein
MKRLLLVAIALLMIVPSVDARRKRPKAGDIQGEMFQDKKYGFTLELNDEWKASVGKAGEIARLVLVQKSYEIPPRYIDAPDYTKVPRVVVVADTTSMGAQAFVDSLVSETYESDQMNEIKKELDILWEQDLIPRGEKRVEIGGERGVMWSAQAQYINEIATSASQLGGIRVNGSYGGAIIALKKSDTIVIFHIMSEWEFFDSIREKAMEVIQSVSWGE